MRRCCAQVGLLIFVAVAAGAVAGCRSAVVVAPRDENTQTIVTVEERPTTNPSAKGLIVRDKR